MGCTLAGGGGMYFSREGCGMYSSGGIHGMYSSWAKGVCMVCIWDVFQSSEDTNYLIEAKTF